MRTFFVLMLLSNLQAFSQDPNIYIRLETPQKLNPLKFDLYLSTDKGLEIRSVYKGQLDSPRYLPLYFTYAKGSSIILMYEAMKGDESNNYQYYWNGPFYPGDSIVLSLTEDKAKVVNRKYFDRELNYMQYLRQYFKKNKKQAPDQSWYDLNRSYQLECAFLKENKQHHFVSDSFYQDKILNLPYEMNSRVFSLPWLYKKIYKDSLITCPVYFDSIINTPDYINYVTGYISNFCLTEKNFDSTLGPFYSFVLHHTKNKLREQLYFFNLYHIDRPAHDSFYSNKFEAFKSFCSDTALLNPIQRVIEEYQKHGYKKMMKEHDIAEENTCFAIGPKKLSFKFC
ncbi:MAG: hypothetical protein JST86_02405 [Bacteroidetes bacterium]|nr:hypothetical protein [Bacteroidota bacterium]